MEIPSSLDNAEEIRKYCLSCPVNALTADKITIELRHWRVLCDKRLYEEMRTVGRDNPISKANVFRFGGLVTALLGLPASFAGPSIGFPIACAGLGLYIYGEIKNSQTKQRREPIRVALERCEALEQELENR